MSPYQPSLSSMTAASNAVQLATGNNDLDNEPSDEAFELDEHWLDEAFEFEEVELPDISVDYI